MSRPRTEPRRTTTALRLPDGLHAQLKAAAEARGVGVNWLMCRLLAEGVDRLVPAEELSLVRRTDSVAVPDVGKSDPVLVAAVRGHRVSVQSGPDPECEDCGCCGIGEAVIDSLWCIKCARHVAPPQTVFGERVPLWERTFEARRGYPCPYSVDPGFVPEPGVH